ncbi:MAG: hypothetical protein DRJ42_26155 [Deltaproteobacteria bacterium]|nr:MAG: hypothetical protein DRJ42_26155 [Deltaproteobacteria bacterium]
MTTRALEQALGKRAGFYHFGVDTAGLLVFRRILDEEDPAPPAGAPRLRMAGEILNKMTMLEIINVIANSGWVGDLRVQATDGTTRTMLIDQGAIKHASSNHTDDLLGEVLFRQGIVDRPVLDQLLTEVSYDKRLGQLVVERGLLEQDQLFGVLRQQVEQIAHGTLLIDQGMYSFTTVDEAAPPPSLTVHISVQGLLMEGVQRIDEMTLFRERVPNSKMCPQVLPHRPERNLDETTATILEWCDGARTIETIARESALGEFLTTKAIYHLLRAKQIELHQDAAVDPDEVRKLVRSFNAVLRDIFMAVATYGGVDSTRQTLATWIQGSGYGPFFGEEVSEDGAIDIEIVVNALASVQAPNPIEALQQGLHELVAFALFSATTALPRDQELVLARDVQRRLKAIHTG